MKIFLVFIFFTLVIACKSFAQIPAQIQEEIEQIAAYGVYITDLEKGYKVVEQGVQTVGNIKNGTFNLHSAFFSSLEAIDPGIKGYVEVAQIALLQVDIAQTFEKGIASLKTSGQLHSGEIAYMNQVYSTVVTDALKDVDALITLTTAGSYSMTDGERLSQIDALYRDMSQKLMFSQAFIAQGTTLDRSRAKDASDITEVGSLYGIK